MNNFQINEYMQIGYLRSQLEEKGITALDEVSNYTQALKELQSKRNMFSYGRYHRDGSGPSSIILSDHNKEQKNCIYWGSNHYLGLNNNERVKERTRQAIDQYGTGAGTAALSGGMTSLHKEIEKRVAQMVGKEDAVLFSTGYTTNLGAISTLPGKTAILIADREAHRSIVDGCRLSGAQHYPFKHNDVNDLEENLKYFSGDGKDVFVLVDSAYSMSGDIAPLQDIVELKNKYAFYLFVDEAHAFGFYGANGGGLCCELGIADKVDFIMSSLSKGVASVGGFVASKEKYSTFLRVNCSAAIFQTCGTPLDAAAVLAALDEIEQNPVHREKLHENNHYFRSNLIKLGFNLKNSKSPIVPLYIKDMKILFNFEREMYEQGIFTIAVAFPAVKLTEGRLRFIVTAAHTKGQIDRTIEVIAMLAKKYNLL